MPVWILLYTHKIDSRPDPQNRVKHNGKDLANLVIGEANDAKRPSLVERW